MSESAADEKARMELASRINDHAADRPELERRWGQVWDSDQLRAEFSVVGFQAPFVRVKRKADGVTGTLLFQHLPRYYFSFEVH